MNTSQYRTALEFGYSKTLITKLLRSKKYSCAWDLIKDLEELEDEEIEHGEKLEDDKCEAEKNMVEKKDNENSSISVFTTANDNANAVVANASNSFQTLSLREETERLYRQSKCLICCRTNRTRVNLPCSHLTHCESCDKLVKRCPLSSCSSEIACTIQTYF